MELDENKKLTVIDGQGKEHEMEILFTYENEERGTKYVFFFDPKTPDDIIPMRYNDNFELEEIEDEEEYEEVEEVFNSYMEDPKIQDLKKN
ncbi:MAG: DUF1292 domain-containing protein [Bacilli bacterium]|nr:DUF1292 domain-containing protein [Bacilli bacterium]